MARESVLPGFVSFAGFPARTDCYNKNTYCVLPRVFRLLSCYSVHQGALVHSSVRTTWYQWHTAATAGIQTAWLALSIPVESNNTILPPKFVSHCLLDCGAVVYLNFLMFSAAYGQRWLRLFRSICCEPTRPFASLSGESELLFLFREQAADAVLFGVDLYRVQGPGSKRAHIRVGLLNEFAACSILLEFVECHYHVQSCELVSSNFHHTPGGVKWGVPCTHRQLLYALVRRPLACPPAWPDLVHQRDRAHQCGLKILTPCNPKPCAGSYMGNGLWN